MLGKLLFLLNFSGIVLRSTNSRLSLKVAVLEKKLYIPEINRYQQHTLAALQRQKMKHRERNGMECVSSDRDDFRSTHIMKLILRTVACLTISQVCTSLKSQSEIKAAVIRAERSSRPHTSTLAFIYGQVSIK